MAAPQRLQSANISPAAKPVDTFLQFDANPAPAQPGGWQSCHKSKAFSFFRAAASEMFKALIPLGN